MLQGSANRVHKTQVSGRFSVSDSASGSSAAITLHKGATVSIEFPLYFVVP